MHYTLPTQDEHVYIISHFLHDIETPLHTIGWERLVKNIISFGQGHWQNKNRFGVTYDDI